MFSRHFVLFHYNVFVVDDHMRIILKGRVEGQSNYINASRVDVITVTEAVCMINNQVFFLIYRVIKCEIVSLQLKLQWKILSMISGR